MERANRDDAPTAELSLGVIEADLEAERRTALRDAHRAIEAALRPLLHRDRLDAILQRAHEDVRIESPDDAAGRLRALVSARIFDALADALDAARQSPAPEASAPVWEHALPPTAQVALGPRPLLAEGTGKRRVRNADSDSLELDIEVESA